MPEPAKVYSLASGILANAETQVMYGGVGIYTDVPGGTGAPRANLGPVVGRATNLTTLQAFSTWSYSNVNWPQNPVPVAGTSQQVRYYRLGSGVRMAVACDATLTSLRGGATTAQVSWDFTNQLLVPYLGTLTISSGTYNSTTGAVVLTMAATPTFGPGVSLHLASLTGTGGYASLDGVWTATAVSGSTVSFTGTTGLGSTTITGGNLTVGGAASQALNVQVLDVQATNCMTVNYAGAGSNATWNYNAAAALILL